MSHATETLKHEVDKLKTLRDQLRVKLHLAGMDAQDGFRELNAEAEEALRDAKRLTRAAVADLAERLRKAVAALGDHHAAP